MPRRRLSEGPPFEQLIVHAKITNTLLAAQLLQHMTQQEVIGLLKSAGASMQQIAEILGTSYATVAVQSGRLRKKTERKGVESHGEEEAGAAETDSGDAGDGPERPE